MFIIFKDMFFFKIHLFMCSELVSTFQWTPSCVSLSPAGVLMAVGTEQGSLHLYHTHTNQVTATSPSLTPVFLLCHQMLLGKTPCVFVLLLSQQEVKSLVSNCDGISGCVFLDESVLWTTSYDGQVEVWNVNSGCRSVF